MTDPHHLRLLEAILFASAEPVSERALSARLPEDMDVPAALKELQEMYAERGINVVRAGKSWAVRTAPDLAQQLNREVDVPKKLSRAAIETLAIIAYHQPITRAEVEEIRGVGLSRGTLDVLMEAGWIKPKGRRRTPGRPMTWGTTDDFLDHFGIEDIRDLPGMDELKAAGLLNAGPAIDVYRSYADRVDAAEGDAEADAEAEGRQLSLIEDSSEGDDDDDSPDSDPFGADEGLDVLDPLDPDDGEAAERA